MDNPSSSSILSPWAGLPSDLDEPMSNQIGGEANGESENLLEVLLEGQDQGFGLKPSEDFFLKSPVIPVAAKQLEEGELLDSQPSLNRKRHFCNVATCDGHFSSYSGLARHWREKHQREILLFRCSECSFRSVRPGETKRHQVRNAQCIEGHVVKKMVRNIHFVDPKGSVPPKNINGSNAECKPLTFKSPPKTSVSESNVTRTVVNASAHSSQTVSSKSLASSSSSSLKSSIKSVSGPDVVINKWQIDLRQCSLEQLESASLELDNLVKEADFKYKFWLEKGRAAQESHHRVQMELQRRHLQQQVDFFRQRCMDLQKDALTINFE